MTNTAEPDNWSVLQREIYNLHITLLCHCTYPLAESHPMGTIRKILMVTLHRMTPYQDILVLQWHIKCLFAHLQCKESSIRRGSLLVHQVGRADTGAHRERISSHVPEGRTRFISVWRRQSIACTSVCAESLKTTQ